VYLNPKENRRNKFEQMRKHEKQQYITTGFPSNPGVKEVVGVNISGFKPW
jgi:hypothetical protein